MAVDFNVKDIDVGKALEQHSFPFHYGLAGQSADISETEYGGTVADYGDQVAAPRVLEGIAGVVLNLQARFGHSGSVGQTQIALGSAGLGGCDFDLPWSCSAMIVESFLFSDRHELPPAPT